VSLKSEVFFITGVQEDGQGKKAEEKPRNTLYVFDYMGITVDAPGDMPFRSTERMNRKSRDGTYRSRSDSEVLD